MITIIAPISDASFSRNVVENFERQTVDARLIVVQNNGGTLTDPPEAAHLIVSEPGKTLAINAAMELVGEGVVVIFDQDDWYGAESVAKKVADLESADIVGMPHRWVRLPDGRLLKFANEHLDPEQAGFLWAGSLAFKASAFEPMPERFVLGCEQRWVERRQRAGCKFRMGDYPDIYQRHDGSHMWRPHRGKTVEQLVRSGILGEVSDLGQAKAPFEAPPGRARRRSSPRSGGA
jgi:hypothetical protein